jgi:erythromycin esterase-like protein
LKDKSKHLLSFLFLILSFWQFSLAQTLLKRYDLNFQDISACNKSWLSSGNSAYGIDSNEMRAGKPSFKLFYNKSASGDSMFCNLSQIIVLPKLSKPRSCEVSVFSKGRMIKGFGFSVILFDKKENRIASKSITVNTEKWQKNTIGISLANASAMRISLNYHGDTNIGQAIWIDRIAIAINGEDVTLNDLYTQKNLHNTKIDQVLEKRFIIPFSPSNDSTLLKRINELKGKRIVGLGESMHGSSTIQSATYQFIKNLIVANNCRLVLLEVPIDKTLLIDEYVLGKLPLSYRDQIIADLRPSAGGYRNLIDFVDWLKTYNANSADKVHIFGIDSPIYPEMYLFEYYLTLLGKKEGSFFLKAIAENDLEEVLNLAQSDNLLQARLGSKLFQHHISFLREVMVRKKNGMDWQVDRDSNMFQRLKNLEKMMLEPGQTAVVYAHSAHITPRAGLDDYMAAPLPLGHYIKESYRERYFTVSFQAGSGTYTQDECSINSKLITDTLPKPPTYSFEHAGLATGISYFYYPSRFLADGILSYADIPRASRYANLYRFSSLKKSFDAYIFVKSVKPIEDVEPSAMLYNMDYFSLKRRALEKIMEEIGQ